MKSFLMDVLLALASFGSLFLVFPDRASPELVVPDAVAPAGAEVTLRAETKGKFFGKGGEVVEFAVDGRSLGKTLSGGDGLAFMAFTPPGTGLFRVTARSGSDEGRGLLLSLKRGSRIVFIDVENSLFERPFSRKSKQGSREAIRAIKKRFPVLFIETGILSVRAARAWLKENGFGESPVIPWGQGDVFDDVAAQGFKIRAVIGSAAIVEPAKRYGAQVFIFGEGGDAESVRGWKEIRQKLR